MDTSKDTPGVIVPPPLLALGVVVIGLILDHLLPAYILSVLLSMPVRVFIGVVLIGLGGGLGFLAVQSFRAAGTNVEPWKPSTALVASGVFLRLRNPMYVGGSLILAGLAILLASDWMLVLTIVAMPVIHYGVVKREERYLAGKFGEPYVRYMEQVPRYGWPF